MKEVAAAFGKITQAWMRNRYLLIDSDDYEFELGEDDLRYTWENFLDVRRFFRKAADAGRAVVFTVDG